MHGPRTPVAAQSSASTECQWGDSLRLPTVLATRLAQPHSVASKPEECYQMNREVLQDVLNSVELARKSLEILSAPPPDSSTTVTDTSLVDLAAIRVTATEVVRLTNAIHNTGVPVMKLPQDIMSLICEMVQCGHVVQSPASGPGGSPTYCPTMPKKLASWVPQLMSVCRSWRRAALLTPSLWTTVIVPISRRRTVPPPHVSLVHSSQALLNVSIGVRRRDRAAITEVLQQLPRIRQLHLYGRLLTGHLKLLEYRAPQLQVLALHAGMQGYARRDYGTHPIPDGFLGGDLSSIRSLALSWINRFPTSNCNLSSLRQLHLHRVCDAALQPQSSLLLFLASMPGLEDLMFSKCFFLADTGSAPEGPPHLLPSLKRLALVNMKGTHHILSRLHLRPETSLVLLSPWTHETRRILPNDTTFLPNLRQLHNIRVTFMFPVHRLSILAVGDSSALRIEQPFEEPSPRRASAADNLASLSALFEVVTSLWIFPHRSLLALKECQAAFPKAGTSHLVRLFTDISKHNTILHYIATELPGPGGGVPFPSLAELHVQLLCSTGYEALISGLRARHLLGHPIADVHIYWMPPAHNEWEVFQCRVRRNIAPAELQPFVRTFHFHVDECMPPMERIEICTSQSGEAWNWPTWSTVVRPPLYHE